MRTILGCVVAVLVGCGGGSDSPEDKCDDLVDLVCDRAVECVPSAGTHDQCVTEAQMGLDCSAATSVSPGYGSCVMTVRNASCATLFPNMQLTLPAECQGVILIGSSADQ